MKFKHILSKNKFILIALLFFVTDFSLTWYFLNFSSHADEGNPLFDIDGGYLALALNFFYLVVIFLLERFLIRKYETVVIDSKNALDYTKKLITSDESKFIFISFSFAFVVSTLSSRLVAIIDWIIYGLYESNFYQTKYAILRSKMPLNRFDPIVAVIVFLVSLILWYKLEFLKQKKLSDIS